MRGSQPASQEAMATERASSEIIEKQRTKLLHVLQQDPDSILDTLASRRLISEDEYEMLEEIPEPLKKSRKLLIVVQKKGEESCRRFLQCLSDASPEAATVLGFNYQVPHQGTEASRSAEVSRDPADPFSLGRKTPGNDEISVLSEEKGCVDWETPEFFRYEESKERETSRSSREKEEGRGASQVLASHSVGRVEYEDPTSITYLSDGERYEEPDDSLYLAEGEYPESVGYPGDVEAIVEEGASDDLRCFAYDEEDHEYEETVEFSNEESSCESSENSISLEEEEKSTEERKRVFQHVLSCLNMDRSRKLLPDFVTQFSMDRGSEWTPKTPGDLAWNFLMKVQALDLTARDFILRHKTADEESEEELLTEVENLAIEDIQTIHPLDVLCACMLCSHGSLQREVMSSMYQCRFALPLLLPDAENNKSILMLGAMKDLARHPMQPSGGPPRETEAFLSLMKVPVISFVRLGHCSFSKSRILNALLSSSQQKPHKIFLHQDLSVPVLPPQISGGLVEVTWCFPDNKELKECPHVFQKPVAVANLRGDLESFWTQFGFLVEVSSAMFFFTDYLGEREWDLLMFLGEDAIERCYFVLGPQAKESEEAQMFQRILSLKPSQLLFGEVEEAGGRRKTMEALRAALQEVMSSSLRCVSLEDMASLARELGIQVDQDLEITRDIHVSPRTAEGENQQTHQTKSASESRAQVPITEPGAQCENSQNARNLQPTPVFTPHPVDPWPLPTTLGSNLYHASLIGPWVPSSRFGSQQRAKWFCRLPHQNTRVHSRGKSFGIQYFQPWTFYSGEGFMKYSGTPRGYHLSGKFGRSQGQTSHVRTHPESLQEARTFPRSGTVASHVGHSHSPGPQAARAAGKPQPVKACAQGMQLTEATGTSMRTTSHIKYPHPPSCQPAGASQERKTPVSHQGSQRVIKGRPSEPAFQPGSQSTSGSKLSSTSQFNSHQPQFQAKHFEPIQPSQKKTLHSQPSQAKSPHPQPSQAKPPHSQPSQAKPPHPQPSQAKPTHPQPSQAKPTHPQPSQAKPSHPQPSQAKPSSSRSTQFKPHRPHQSQSKPKSTQHSSSQTKPSQAKAYYPRTGKR
ncbi:caspase recruitment domain-containing protein 6 isoform X1 [Peromyscus maniculatus bairdii]|uniref:caspase recruitment domain-containing protein 6 isoform X1 n=2 Tax=Peromyscus maniculatus bairdii TaxID=230844 RepID=UPI003FD32FAD